MLETDFCCFRTWNKRARTHAHTQIYKKKSHRLNKRTSHHPALYAGISHGQLSLGLITTPFEIANTHLCFQSPFITKTVLTIFLYFGASKSYMNLLQYEIVRPLHDIASFVYWPLLAFLPNYIDSQVYFSRFSEL